MKKLIYLALIFSISLNAQENDFPTIIGNTYENGLDTIVITDVSKKYDSFTTMYYVMIFDEPAWVTPMFNSDYILVEMINFDYKYTIRYYSINDDTIVIGNKEYKKK